MDAHCDDLDPCTVDSCLGQQVCANVPAEPGLPCGDRSYCSNSAECLWLTGTGADGDLVEDGQYLLDAEGLAPAYSLAGTAEEGDDLVTLAEAPAGIGEGDEVLILNLQGTAGDHGSVGGYGLRASLRCRGTPSSWRRRWRRPMTETARRL